MTCGCSIVRPTYRVSGISRSEVRSYRAEAEQRLGMEWRGKRIRVTAIEGTHQSNDPAWLGRPHAQGIATGIWRPTGKIIYYTTDGRVRPATGMHEWAHEILGSHGVPCEEHHGIMQKRGIP